MASAYGNVVQHWRARVVAEITSQTATSATVRTRCYWCSISWGYQVNGNGSASCGGTGSGSRGFFAYSATGATVETLVAEVSRTVTKGSRAQSVPCSAQVNITGGYHNGTSNASVSVTVPAIDYAAPAAPSSCSASRVSDGQARVTWSNGGTSATQPRSATLVERQTDGGSWVQVASVGASVTSYTDNGVSANHRYAYRVRAQGAGGYSGYSTSGYVYTTPAAPSSVTASKVGSTSVRLDVAGAAPYATSYEVQRSSNGGGSWQAAGTASSLPWTDPSAPAGTVRYRVRAARGSLASGWRESNSVTTVVAPLAPSVSVSPTVAATGAAVTVTWRPNHPDGSAQTSAQVEVDGVAHDVDGASTSYRAASAAGAHEVRVRTRGLYDGWGAWSSKVSYTVADLPSVVVTEPAVDGSVIETLPVSVAWEVVDPTGVAAQRLVVRDASGAVAHSADLGPDARSYRLGSGTYLMPNHGSYEVSVTVTGGSSLSATASRALSVEYAGPALPWAEVSYDPTTLSATVAVRPGEAGWRVEGVFLVSPEDNAGGGVVPITAGCEVSDGGEVSFGEVMATDHVSVARVLPDGSQWEVEGAMAGDGFARDPLPPLNTDYRYVVTAASEAGTASVTEVDARVDSLVAAVNFGRGAAEFVGLALDPSHTASYETSTELYHFADGGAGGGLPVAYPMGSSEERSTESATIVDEAERRRVEALARAHPMCWVRDLHGNRRYCHAAWSFADRMPWTVAEVTATLTATRFEEAWDG